MGFLCATFRPKTYFGISTNFFFMEAKKKNHNFMSLLEKKFIDVQTYIKIMYTILSRLRDEHCLLTSPASINTTLSVNVLSNFFKCTFQVLNDYPTRGKKDSSFIFYDLRRYLVSLFVTIWEIRKKQDMIDFAVKSWDSGIYVLEILIKNWSWQLSEVKNRFFDFLFVGFP